MTRKEFTDVIYDTLMQNKQNPQLKLNEVTDQFCLSEKGVIGIEHEDEFFTLLIFKDKLKNKKL